MINFLLELFQTYGCQLGSYPQYPEVNFHRNFETYDLLRGWSSRQYFFNLWLRTLPLHNNGKLISVKCLEIPTMHCNTRSLPSKVYYCYKEALLLYWFNVTDPRFFVNMSGHFWIRWERNPLLRVRSLGALNILEEKRILQKWWHSMGRSLATQERLRRSLVSDSFASRRYYLHDHGTFLKQLCFPHASRMVDLPTIWLKFKAVRSKYSIYTEHLFFEISMMRFVTLCFSKISDAGKDQGINTMIKKHT